MEVKSFSDNGEKGAFDVGEEKKKALEQTGDDSTSDVRRKTAEVKFCRYAGRLITKNSKEPKMDKA